MSILVDVDELLKNQTNWNYYHIYHDNIKNILNNPEEFINSYFISGQKEILINDKYLHYGRLTRERALHSVSTYFMGIIVATKLELIDLLNINANGRNFNFAYLWYLICLSHDFGYFIERDKDKAEHIRDYDGDDITDLELFCLNRINKFIEKYGVSSTIWNGPSKSCFSQMNGLEHLFEDFNYTVIKGLYHNTLKHLIIRNKKIKCPTYTNGVISRYFAYRLCGENIAKIDHGIAGGYLFFDKLIKNYIKNYVNLFHYYDFYQFCDFYDSYSDRQFNIEQFTIFAYVADCIICHNIWSVQLDDIDKFNEYKKYKLDDFIGKRYPKINLDKNPYLFILSLCDSIDPVKIFNCRNQIDAIDIMEKMNLEYIDNSIEIEFNDDRFGYYANRIKELETWLDVSVSENDSSKKVIIKSSSFKKI